MGGEILGVRPGPPLRGWALGRLVMLEQQHHHKFAQAVTTKCFWTFSLVFNTAGLSEKPLVVRISEWAAGLGRLAWTLLRGWAVMLARHQCATH